MFDPNKILGQLLTSPGTQGLAGGLAGGLLSSLLVSKSGRKLGKKALRYGAVAAVGALAYNAWKRHRTSAGAPGHPEVVQVDTELPPAESGFLPPPGDVAGSVALGTTLIRAMIAAARADGKIDPAESTAILERLQTSELSPEDKGTLMNELAQPVSLDALVESVRTPQMAMEVYLASLLAIEVDTPAERAYLSLLSARLGLEPGLVDRLHEQVEKA